MSHLASHWMTSRTCSKRIQRSFPVNRSPVPMKIRKSRNILGRAYELRRHLLSGLHDEKTRQMSWKLTRQGDLISLEELQNLIDYHEHMVDNYGKTEKHNAIGRWKTRMRTNPPARSSWITRKKLCRYLPVSKDEGKIGI